MRTLSRLIFGPEFEVRLAIETRREETLKIAADGHSGAIQLNPSTKRTSDEASSRKW
jgi:hypothetical protein